MESEGSNADYGDRMEAESGRYISISVYMDGSIFAVRVPLVQTREGKRDCVLDTWVMTRQGLERTRKVGEKRKARCTNDDAIIFTHLGGGTSMACTRGTHQNTKRQRSGRGKRKKRRIVGDK